MNRQSRTLPRAGGTRAGAWRAGLGIAAVGLGLLGCDLGVENPGPIEDEALNDPRAMTPLVVGMGSDLSAILDDYAYFMGIVSRDIWHSGAFEPEFFMQDGRIEPRHVNALWAGAHRARWTAESGIARMKAVLQGHFETSPLAPQASVWAGFANRVLGENVCQAVIDGGAAEPNTKHFERAEAHFTEALRLAQAQSATQWVQTAYAGRAQARLALGRYDEAAADARNVPDAFVFQALFANNSNRERNWLVNESVTRRYFTIYGTWALEVKDDPRVQVEDQFTSRKVLGVDGRSPFYKQLKYKDYGDDIDLARGDEMRLIEAEAAIRAGDLAGGMALINAVRGAAGVPPVAASTRDEAIARLRTERAIVLWMEARRLFDLRRFDDPFLNGRGSCIPPSENEQNTNPNLS